MEAALYAISTLATLTIIYGLWKVIKKDNYEEFPDPVKEGIEALERLANRES